MSELKVGDVVSVFITKSKVVSGLVESGSSCLLLNCGGMHFFRLYPNEENKVWQRGIHSSLIPEGFAIVPIKPTDEMICDGCDVDVGLEDSYYLSKATTSWEDCKKVYAAMIKSQIKPTDK